MESPFNNAFSIPSIKIPSSNVHSSVNNLQSQFRKGSFECRTSQHTTGYNTNRDFNVLKKRHSNIPNTERLLKCSQATITNRMKAVVDNSAVIFAKVHRMSFQLHKCHKQSLLKQLKRVAIEVKINRIPKKKVKKVVLRRPIIHKRFAAILLIQRAVRLRRVNHSLHKSVVPSLEMMGLSPFINFKTIIKGYMQGWKTRRILNSQSMKNKVLQIFDLRKFYTSEGDSNKYVQKAKSDYIDSINLALRNPNWWKEFASEKTLEEKRLRVQKMREKTKRIRESKFDPSDAGFDNNSYANDQSLAYQSNKSMSSGGMSLAFDFSGARNKKNNRNDSQYERKKRKNVEDNIQQRKTKFLKSRASLKYDPMRAIDEDKEIRKALASEMASVDLNDLKSNSYSESQGLENSPKITAKHLKLGHLINKERNRKQKDKKLSVKEIMNSSVPQIKKTNSKVSESFQKLDYLKKVPKRIDCWLSKNVANKTNDLSDTSMEKSKGYNTNRVLSNSSNIIEDFSQFSKSVGLEKKMSKIRSSKLEEANQENRNNLTTRKMSDSVMSGDSFNLLNTNRSQSSYKHGLEGTSPKKSNLFSNEGECLEYLLDRLEVNSSHLGLMSSIDKLMLKEDKGLYSKLKDSQSLLQIFKLKNHVEKSNSKESDEKRNYDFEFEKLLLKLKDEYKSLHAKNKHQDTEFNK